MRPQHQTSDQCLLEDKERRRTLATWHNHGRCWGSTKEMRQGSARSDPVTRKSKIATKVWGDKASADSWRRSHSRIAASENFSCGGTLLNHINNTFMNCHHSHGHHECHDQGHLILIFDNKPLLYKLFYSSAVLHLVWSTSCTGWAVYSSWRPTLHWFFITF